MSEQTINKGIMIAGGLLSLGILGYLFFREKEEVVEEAEFTIVQETKPVQEKQEQPTAVVTKTPKPVKKEDNTVVLKKEVPIKPDDNFPLKLGSKGERVKQLQVYLLRNHGSAGIVTDEFDKSIEERVLKYLKVKTVSKALFIKLNMDGSKKKKNGSKTKY